MLFYIYTRSKAHYNSFLTANSNKIQLRIQGGGQGKCSLPPPPNRLKDIDQFSKIANHIIVL